MTEGIPTLRGPLENALDAELRRIERFIARAWIALTGAATVGAIVVALTVSRTLGGAMAIAGVITLAFFLVAARWLDRRPLTKRTPLVVVAVEGMLPWIYFAVLSQTQGAAYALASWVPPLVFAALVVTWVARLQPIPPLIVSAVGAASYLVLYFVFVYPHIPRGAAHLLLHDPPMQLTRATSILGAGVLGMLVAKEMRRAIARADTTLRRQELFGKYRLLRKIGAGSGGSVHEAIYCPEGGFERRVAIKQLHPNLITEPAFVEGFRAEAELGARLAHPNVVTIHDFGRHQETFFMAMEFVDGLPLGKLMYRARRAKVVLSEGVVGHIGHAVLSGLDHAHEGVRDASGHALHILHRDVCPQNLLVSRIGEVKLTDFGIARVLGHTGEGASTRTIAGHEAYMAPEQIEGKNLSLAMDLFAVGVILWELVTGRRLFARENPAATLMAVIAGPILPPLTIRAELHPAWDAFFVRALARDTSERFSSAREMLEALDAIPTARSDSAGTELAELVVRFSLEPALPEQSTEERAEEPTTRDSTSAAV